VPLAEPAQVGHTCHRAIVIEDFADHPGGMEVGETGQIDRGLCVAAALEDAAGASAEREDMSRYREIFPSAASVDSRPDRLRAIMG
jgi:hypothetical protein